MGLILKGMRRRYTRKGWKRQYASANFSREDNFDLFWLWPFLRRQTPITARLPLRQHYRLMVRNAQKGRLVRKGLRLWGLVPLTYAADKEDLRIRWFNNIAYLGFRPSWPSLYV